MPRESIFDPIPDELLREARSRLVLANLTVDQWADQNGIKRSVAHDVIGGRRKAIRGESLRAAIKLGLRPDPSHPAPAPQDLPVTTVPAGRTLAGGRPNASCDRPPVLQLGEAAR